MDNKSNKKLSEMTLEELWELFPIFLTEHKPYWSTWYLEEKKFLKSILLPDTDFYHIGSTAINGIWAKPTIDIIIAVNTSAHLKQSADILQNNGYFLMSLTEKRASLNKGYTGQGFAEKVFHIHLRLKNDIDEIYFRDYLNMHPKIAKEYEELKLVLWKKYEHNRDAYTDAKSDFVNKYTALANLNRIK